jgi:glycosyltransferase involved in cell wall biosynthesis
MTDRKIFIDATGALATFGTSPTGIPRVEAFLVQSALADAGKNIVLVRYDRLLQGYRSLNFFEEQQIRDWHLAPLVHLTETSFWKKAGQVFHAIRHYPMMSREIDRQFAEKLTGSKRRGAFYQLIKLAIRLYRVYRQLLAKAIMLYTQRKGAPVDTTSGVVLMSNSVFLGSAFAPVLNSCSELALIVHDMIPLMRMDFAISAQHAGTFADRMTQLLRRKFTALCASQATCTMLMDYRKRIALPEGDAALFPMPSILHATSSSSCIADPSQLVADLLADKEPFVLYCSTIEVRKNHLMLARVWKRAHRTNTRLPRLVCVGKWGWGVDPLVNFLRANPALKASINFVGTVSDAELVALYRRALFGVVPSYLEGWGFAASECLDFGLPVIVSTAPALQEASGRLMPAIDPDDFDGWYQAICALAASQEQQRELADKISRHHKPTRPGDSWSAIKSALQRSGLPNPPSPVL